MVTADSRVTFWQYMYDISRKIVCPQTHTTLLVEFNCDQSVIWSIPNQSVINKLQNTYYLHALGCLAEGVRALPLIRLPIFFFPSVWCQFDHPFYCVHYLQGESDLFPAIGGRRAKEKRLQSLVVCRCCSCCRCCSSCKWPVYRSPLRCKTNGFALLFSPAKRNGTGQTGTILLYNVWRRVNCAIGVGIYGHKRN